MSKENVAVIQGIYDVFATCDFAGVLSRMSPDIVWNEAENFPYADGNPYTGPEALSINGTHSAMIGSRLVDNQVKRRGDLQSGRRPYFDVLVWCLVG